MRDAFSNALVDLAKNDRRVVLLTGDHGYALFDEFRRCCPDQYINAGIAEQNMVGMAAGLARVGYRPFVYGLSAFVPVRVLEQIKLDAAHDELPVVFLGDGAGFVYSYLGTSHQSTEDIACTRAVPGLSILSPADRHEMHACMNWAYQRKKTVYLRMGKADLGDVHPASITLQDLAGPLCVRQERENNVALIATGSMVRPALALADALSGAVSVYSVPILKPAQASAFMAELQRYKSLVTLGEHSVHGGLGSLLTEIFSEFSPKNILRLGVSDRYSHGCGSYAYLLSEHGLDHASLLEKTHAFLQSNPH